MSGRKSSEVAAILAQGEKVRKLTDETYTQKIESDLQNLSQNLKNIEKVQNQAAGLNADLEKDAEKMFGEKALNARNNFSALREEISRVTLPKNEIEGIRKELKRLDAELEKADAEAEKIRVAIRGKRNGWYCDEEYARANNLVKVYQKLREDRIALQHRATELSKTSGQTLNKATADFRQLENFDRQLNDMNATAKKRLEADNMRDELRKLLSEIPNGDAKKFFADEYQKISNDLQNAIADNDDAVISSFRDKYNHLIEFSAKLKARVELWQQQKADSDNLLKEVETLADFGLIGPVEYFNEGENGEKTELFEYLKKYAQKDLRPQYESLLKDANNLRRREEFSESMGLLNKAAKFVQQARDDAAELQEEMLKKTELAGAIQDVMEGLNYEIKTQFIDGNPKNGYRITCTAGNEIIDFDRIDIDDDGKVIVKIDHTEALRGSCPTSWQEIAQRMQDNGIPVTNVMLDGGGSVLRRTHVAGRTKSEEKVRVH